MNKGIDSVNETACEFAAALFPRLSDSETITGIYCVD
jgi:hypothetical protein